MKILIKLAFVGTAYCGWQAQNNGNSIQQQVTYAAEALFGYRCDVTGCSRTDAGVHANCFCATIARHGAHGISTTIPLDRIPRAINRFLPEDIVVLSAYEVDDGFHPRYNAVSKEYIYKIYTRTERDPFLNERVLHLPHELDERRMNEAAGYYIGTHDFMSFMSSGSKISDTVRTVSVAEVTRDDFMLTFRVAADGFLYNMVRIMAGTLVLIGEKKAEPCEIEKIIADKKRSNAGITAPACGLYLNKVEYGIDQF